MINADQDRVKNCTFEISKDVFKAVPKLKVLFVVVRNIDLSSIENKRITKLLEESWESSRQQTSVYENVQSHPNILMWRQVFQSLKISTKKYTSSVESMAKRASKSDSKPFSINALVDLYNAFSLKYLIPFGGFDMKNINSLDLRVSKDTDKFTALDSTEPVDVLPGEIVYATGNTVVTRHINWRQSKEGLISHSTTNVCFMAEVLDEYPKTKLAEMIDEFKSCCIEYLKVTPAVYMVDETNPIISF